VSPWPASGKHRDDERPGIACDTNGARRQGGRATKEGHWQPVLEEIVVGDEPGDLASSQSADHPAHAAGSRLDHRDEMGVPEMRDAIEHEPGRGPPRDDGHRHTLGGDGMPQHVEGPHVRGGDDDPLPSLMGGAQDGEIRA